jgi:hypothetical protein
MSRFGNVAEGSPGEPKGVIPRSLLARVVIEDTLLDRWISGDLSGFEPECEADRTKSESPGDAFRFFEGPLTSPRSEEPIAIESPRPSPTGFRSGSLVAELEEMSESDSEPRALSCRLFREGVEPRAYCANDAEDGGLGVGFGVGRNLVGSSAGKGAGRLAII